MCVYDALRAASLNDHCFSGRESSGGGGIMFKGQEKKLTLISTADDGLMMPSSQAKHTKTTNSFSLEK